MVLDLERYYEESVPPGVIGGGGTSVPPQPTTLGQWVHADAGQTAGDGELELDAATKALTTVGNTASGAVLKLDGTDNVAGDASTALAGLVAGDKLQVVWAGGAYQVTVASVAEASGVYSVTGDITLSQGSGPPGDSVAVTVGKLPAPAPAPPPPPADEPEDPEEPMVDCANPPDDTWTKPQIIDWLEAGGVKGVKSLKKSELLVLAVDLCDD